MSFIALFTLATSGETSSRLLRETLRTGADLSENRRRKIAGTISAELIEASEMEQVGTGLLRSSAATSEVHYPPNCKLGYSYDIWKQTCFNAPAVVIPRECTEDDDSNINCLDTNTQTSNGWTSYNMKTQSSDDYSSLISSAVSAEGTGWGISASASVDYMQQHAVTSNSVGFWIGASGDVYNSLLRNPTELELNDAAKIMLATDWKAFISAYGTQYVKQIVHSTNFLGSAQISSTSESSASELSVAAELSYSGFFSASASASYDEATQGKSNSLKIRVNSNYQGEIIEYESSSTLNAAQQLAKDFETWTEQVSKEPEANSTPTRIVFRSLFDLQEVQKIVVESYPSSDWSDIADAFQTGLPTHQTLETISEEAVWTKAQLNTLNLYRTYQCVTDNDDLLEKVNDFRDVLNSHLTGIQSLDGADIALREAEILAGDYSWFLGRDFETTKTIEDDLAQCPADMCKCMDPGNITKAEVYCTQSGLTTCGSNKACYGEETVPREDWDQLCTSNWCICDVGFMGGSDWNDRAIYCNEQEYRYCSSSKKCVYTGFWKYGQWDHLCFAK